MGNYALCVSVLFALIFGTNAWGRDQRWKVHFGNLHSHSGVSDGVDTPPHAYKFAKDEAKIEFLCLSEHNHMVTQAGMDDVKAAADAATSADFVGLAGQEYSTISGGNHINLHDVLTPIPEAMNNNYRQLFEQWLPEYVRQNPTRIVVGQFNHPADILRDYGIARIGGFVNYDNDWAAFVSKVDPWVSLIAIVSGPADSNMAQNKVPPKNVHRDTENAMIRIWHSYLERGFHLSPVADQDNHRKTWGARTTARTGVWLDKPLTRENLLKALKAGNCFATEDKNLMVWFSISEQPMGSILADPGTTNLAFEISVKDEDEPQSEYHVDLFKEVIADGRDPAILQRDIPLKSEQVWTANIPHQGGVHECFFIRVRQWPLSTKDDAWSAPIWIDPARSAEPAEHTEPLVPPPGMKFVRSKNSSVCHLPECVVAHRISPANRVWSADVPANRRLHENCPID